MTLRAVPAAGLLALVVAVDLSASGCSGVGPAVPRTTTPVVFTPSPAACAPLLPPAVTAPLLRDDQHVTAAVVCDDRRTPGRPALARVPARRLPALDHVLHLPSATLHRRQACTASGVALPALEVQLGGTGWISPDLPAGDHGCQPRSEVVLSLAGLER